MSKFIAREKKTIEAEQFMGPGEKLPAGVQFDIEEAFYYVTPMQGRPVRVAAGEWIVEECGGKGHYPIDNEEFDRLYEPAPPSSRKTLINTDVNKAKDNVPDLEVFGDGDIFKLMSKASSQKEGWMKSTKACKVPGGCIVQVTTQQRNPDGSYAVAEAVTFVPGVCFTTWVDKDGGVTHRTFDPTED